MVITINEIMVVCGWIITLGGAGAIIYNVFTKVRKPKKDLDARIDKIEKDVTDIKGKLDKDYSALDAQQASINLLTRSMFGLIENKITGNNSENLKEIRDELIEALTDGKSK